MFTYSSDNGVLKLDNMSLCNEDIISEWVHDNIDDVLFRGHIHRSYITGRLQIDVIVVVHGFVVAIYEIINGLPDKFLIQSVGYENAINYERSNNLSV